jgi:hypothetical protein
MKKRGKIRLRFHHPRKFNVDRSPSIKGDVFAERRNGKELIGRISARIIQVARAANNRVDLFDVCDGDDQLLHEVGSACLDFRMGPIKDELTEAGPCSDVLYVHSIELSARSRRACAHRPSNEAEPDKAAVPRAK